MSDWLPHVTVATVIERDGKYLLVEERDKTTGALVYNQPAGHLDPGETLEEAAIRETREETGWHIRLLGILGFSLYQPGTAGVAYYRTSFLAEALSWDEQAELDPVIHRVHWLTPAAIKTVSARMRSPLVLADIERHQRGQVYPLEIISHYLP